MRKLILLLNGTGLLLYLGWLAGRAERIFYTQDGILLLLPLLPFVLVFVVMLSHRDPDDEPVKREEDPHG